MNIAENIPPSGLPSVSKYLNESGLYTHKMYAGVKCFNDTNVPLTDRKEEPEDGDTDNESYTKPMVCFIIGCQYIGTCMSSTIVQLGL